MQRRIELSTGINNEGMLFADEDDGFEDEMAIGDKLKEENYYKYHENVAHYDPRG